MRLLHPHCPESSSEAFEHNSNISSARVPSKVVAGATHEEGRRDADCNVQDKEGGSDAG
jgi:hypothetical protein